MPIQLQPDRDQRARIKVVLVSPRNPLNIGASARALANFGFSQLAVVAAYEPHWREVRSAIGAPEVLKDAESADSLAEVVADCTLVLGTGTVAYRKPKQRVIPLPDLAPLVREALNPSGKLALIFGPEKHGLTRDDLSYCHAFIEIPTDAAQPSMNLGQAVAVCLYELSAHILPGADQLDIDARPQSRGKTEEEATASGRLEILGEVVEQVMEAAHYSPASRQSANQHDLRLLLRRLAPSDKDTRRMLGLFRHILWRLKR